MHELSIMFEVIKRVQAVAKLHEVKQVAAIVLEVGEVATVIPHFLRECYPVAVDGTELQNTELIIEIIPARGQCRHCQTEYHLMPTKGECPKCHQQDFFELSGREFSIKEIKVLEGGSDGSSENH